MPTHRQIFLNSIAQTSALPLMLEVDYAKGMYLFTTSGDKYLDMNSGISVSSLGHCHPAVVAAVKNQVDKHMHTMVYGEHIQQSQVKYAATLISKLDDQLNCVYYVMTGTEAVEIAMKMSRRYSNRTEIIACKGAYHGSTYGSESLRSDTHFKMHFAPGVPGVNHIDFNDLDQLSQITKKTACVIVEAVQAESGVRLPKHHYLKLLEKRCKETGALFILDEIQTGFGRTGHLFAYQKYDLTPDAILIGKSMGGGMPIAALISDKSILGVFSDKPTLGHLTTFGGHPVSCAAANATLEVLSDGNIIEQVENKEKLFKSLLNHNIVKEIRSSGLMMAVELKKRKYLKHVIQSCFEHRLIVDYFLFNDRSFRLAPPLVISNEEINIACRILNQAFDTAKSKYEK